jgi:signal transduction histidine kinase
LKALQKGPDPARKSFLTLSAGLLKAENAFLLLPGQSSTPLFLKKKPAIPQIDIALDAAESSSRDVINFGNLLIIRLRIQQEQAGVLFLMLNRKKRKVTLNEDFRELCNAYALWESANQLRNLLQEQRKSLHSLSAESASVAQEYVRLTEQMNASQARLQSITKGILRTQEEERAKISRELHDGIGQELTALKMNLDLLSTAVAKSLSIENQDRWSDAQALAEQTLQDVRELSRLLRPRMLDDLGLFPTLRWYIRSFSKRVELPVELELQGTEERLNPEIQTILFRIVQEALNNIAKHSEAKSASVQLDCLEEEARLKIVDDGRGFDTSQYSYETSSGLAGMRDRVALYKGKFSLHSQLTKGTTIEVTIPLI